MIRGVTTLNLELVIIYMIQTRSCPQAVALERCTFLMCCLHLLLTRESEETRSRTQVAGILEGSPDAPFLLFICSPWCTIPDHSAQPLSCLSAAEISKSCLSKVGKE